MPARASAAAAWLIPRPTVVTVAAVLLLLAAPALALHSVPPFVFAERVLDVYTLAYAGTEAEWTVEQAVNDLLATSSRTLAVALLAIAGLLPVLTVAILAGLPAGRVVTWLLGGLAVCASGPFLLLGPTPPPGVLPQHEMDRLLEAAMPGWIGLTGVVAGAVSTGALVVAMVLLGTPRANDFFRKPPPVVPPPPPLHPR